MEKKKRQLHKQTTTKIQLSKTANDGWNSIRQFRLLK